MRSTMMQRFGPPLTMLALSLASFSQQGTSPGTASGLPDTQEGQNLYALPGNCSTCHQLDGQGIPGAIPPLAKSLWVTEDADRLIKICLKGLEGEILVSTKKFIGSMPPQANTSDEDLAKILSYVRNAWGNKASAITAGDIGRVKKELGQKGYSLDDLLDEHPFDHQQKHVNGKYSPEDARSYLDTSQPVVLRTFMPDASPAAFAVSIPGGQYYCWDAGACRLSYAWSLGGFVSNNKSHWEGNGKKVARFKGLPYYRRATKGYDGKKRETLDRADEGSPIYSFVGNENFPFRIGLDSEEFAVSFRGYRLVDGLPEFMYDFGPYRITEYVKLNEARDGIVQHFTVNTDRPVRLSLSANESKPTLLSGPPTRCIISSDAGRLKSGVLELSAAEAQSFSVAYKEIREDTSAKKVWSDPDRAYAEHKAFPLMGDYRTNFRQEKGAPKVVNYAYQVAAMGDTQFLLSKREQGKVVSKPEIRVVGLEKLMPILEPLRKEARHNRYLGTAPADGADIIFAEQRTRLFSGGDVFRGLLYPPVQTEKKYGAFKMHLEFRTPYQPYSMPGDQGRGNSGVFIRKGIEIQILDSYGLDYDESNLPFKPQSHSDQWCGSIYGKHSASVNACAPPLQWQSLDVDCSSESLTVRLNGVVIHKGVAIPAGEGVIRLQDHGCPVSYRNFWILEK